MDEIFTFIWTLGVLDIKDANTNESTLKIVIGCVGEVVQALVSKFVSNSIGGFYSSMKHWLRDQFHS